MLGGDLVSSFQQRNEALNSAVFPGAEDDPWQPYRALIEKYGQGALIVVDLGAGAVDAYREWLLPEKPSCEVHSETVVSVDQDWPSLTRNPGRCRVLADVESLPFSENSVDLVLSRYTLEHLPNPLAVVREVARVLKPGKALVFVTPHRWCYVSLVSYFTPVWFHRLVYRMLGHSGHRLPFCPTYYRFNTPGRIYARARDVGLGVSQLRITVGPPEYSKIFPPALHRVFMWFHILLERSPRLRYYLGINLLGVLQKQRSSASPLRRHSA
jgi:SAM-dependent methyltransferase